MERVRREIDGGLASGHAYGTPTLLIDGVIQRRIRPWHPLSKAQVIMSSRIAIVAGAGGGLGLATAHRHHADGLTVVAVDRNKAGLEELPDEIHTEVADPTDPTVPGPLVDRLTAEVGPTGRPGQHDRRVRAGRGAGGGTVRRGIWSW